METWKKIGKALLFPPVAVAVILLPAATVFMICAMTALGTEGPIATASYVLAFYTLTIWCVRMPQIVASCRRFKKTNKYALRWSEDVRLRMNVSLYGAFFWNGAYAIFQLCLGAYHRSFWYYSTAGYYILLSAMRFSLAGHTRKYKPGEKMRAELVQYLACGIVFLLMNLALTVMIFFMVFLDWTFRHHQITTIAMAAYTFTAFTMAVISLVKYRKYNSPVYSASKAISLAAACVSMLTLEATMLTTFDDGTTDLVTRRSILGISGGAVSGFIIAMAVYMIARASKALKQEDKHE